MSAMLRNWPSRIGDEARLKVEHSLFACGVMPLLAVVCQTVVCSGWSVDRDCEFPGYAGARRE